MREDFEDWFESQQIENTQFPSLIKLFNENKIVLYSTWMAATHSCVSRGLDVTSNIHKEVVKS